MGGEWPSLIAAALSGGIILKLLEYVVEWIKSRYHSKKSARGIVDAHLDPLLKAADEIAGKTRALAERDFVSFTRKTGYVGESDLDADLIGLLYLYAKFWSRIEILERESLGLSIASDRRGALLKGFLSCLESQRIRLVDRVHQKAIGEITTKTLDGGVLRSIGIVEFAKLVNSDAAALAWIQPLIELLRNVHIKTYRQRLLVYGVVVYALIDTLDPDHNSTHLRPAYPNKLSKKSKRDIKFRVFGRYLQDIAGVDRYVGRI